MTECAWAEAAKEEIRQHYDRMGGAKLEQAERWIAGGTRERVPETVSGDYFLDRKTEAALALAELPRGARVLEVGTQYGFFAFRLAARGFDVVAVDLSARAIELATLRARHFGVERLRFLVGDAEGLDRLDEAPFDAVFSFSCLRYLPDPARALRGAREILKPAGKVVVDFPNRYSPWFWALKPRLGIQPHIHDHLYSARQARGALLEAGFSDAVSRTLLFTPRRVSDRLVPVFRWADRIGEGVPGLKSLAGIVLCRGVKPLS